MSSGKSGDATESPSKNRRGGVSVGAPGGGARGRSAQLPPGPTEPRAGGASPFHVLVATDGSARARAARAAAVAFPWPRGARASGVIARRGFAGTRVAGEWPVTVWQALDRSL